MLHSKPIRVALIIELNQIESNLANRANIEAHTHIINSGADAI